MPLSGEAAGELHREGMAAEVVDHDVHGAQGPPDVAEIIGTLHPGGSNRCVPLP